jgi:signal transduction histidine kinase
MSVRGEDVWLAGAGGVQLFRKDRFYLMKWSDPGMPGRLSGIVETETGDLWMNGFSGITHLPADELTRWLRDPDSRVYGERLDELDGLPGFSEEPIPEPSVVEGPDGRLWFATTRGIAWLDPAALERDRNRTPPPVFISSVIANEKTFAGANGLSFPSHTENLEIDYTALSLAIPERVLFRYKLEGVDEGWQNVGTRRQAFYTKLRPAHYIFRVIACNNDGVWNEAGAAFDFSIAPALYQTGWFEILALAAFLAILWGIYQLRLQQLRRQFNIRIEERVGERTRIARELHDTLLQSFQGLLCEFQAARNLFPKRPADAMRTLDDAIGSAEAAIVEGRDAIQDLRVAPGVHNDLAHLLTAAGKELSNAQNSNANVAAFRLTVEGPPQVLSPILQDEIYRIGREILRNAFRHARATRIEVEIRYDGRMLRLRIRDDGIGIDPQVLSKGARAGHWGLPGVRERAKLIGAKLDFWSEEGAGTEVQVTVPAPVAYPKSTDIRIFGLFRKTEKSHAK